MVLIGNLGLGILLLSVYLIKTLTLQYFLHQIIVYLSGILLKFRAYFWTFQWSNPYTQFFIQRQHNDLENILGFNYLRENGWIHLDKSFSQESVEILLWWGWVKLFEMNAPPLSNEGREEWKGGMVVRKPIEEGVV